MNRITWLGLSRILLWLFMLAAGLDKEGDAMMLRSSTFQPLPRNRLMTDNFFAGMSGNSMSRRSLPVSRVVSPNFDGNNRAAGGGFQGGNIFQKPAIFNSYIGYPAESTSRGGFGNAFSAQNSPFKNMFGTDIEKSSGHSTNLGQRKQPENALAFSIGRGNTRMGQFDHSKTANHPFSSIRLTPITQASGISAKGPSYEQPVSGFVGDDLLKNRNQLFSESNRAETYKDNNPFEKPIHRDAFPLPDVNKPITIDLAADEQRRVQYLRKNRKLPPSRNVVNRLSNEQSSKSYFDPFSLPGQNNRAGLNINRNLKLSPLPALPSEKSKQENKQVEIDSSSIDRDGKKDSTVSDPNNEKHIQPIGTKELNSPSATESMNKLTNPDESQVAENALNPQIMYDYDQEHDTGTDEKRAEVPPNIHTYIDNYPNQHTLASADGGVPGRTVKDDRNFVQNPTVPNKPPGTRILSSESKDNENARYHVDPIGYGHDSNKDFDDTLERENKPERHGSNKHFDDTLERENKPESEMVDYDTNDYNDVIGNGNIYDNTHHDGGIPKQGRYDVTVFTDEEITKVPRESDDGLNQGKVITVDSNGGDHPAVKRVVQRTIDSQGEKVVSTKSQLPTDHVGFILTDDMDDDTFESNSYTPHDDRIQRERYDQIPSQSEPMHKENQANTNVITNPNFSTASSKADLLDKTIHVDALGSFPPDNNGTPLIPESGHDLPPAVGSGYLRWPGIATSGLPQNVGIRHPSEIFSLDDAKRDPSHPQANELVKDIPHDYDVASEDRENELANREEILYENNVHEKGNDNIDEKGTIDTKPDFEGLKNGIDQINFVDNELSTPDKAADWDGNEMTDSSPMKQGGVNNVPNNDWTRKDFHDDENIQGSDYNTGPLDESEVIENIQEEGLRLGIMREADIPMHDKEIAEDDRTTPNLNDERKSTVGTSNKDSVSRNTDLHEHINLENMNEYLDEIEENDQTHSNKNDIDPINVDKEKMKDHKISGSENILDENGIPTFTDYTYDDFGKSSLKDFKDEEEYSGEDDFSINSNPISSNFDLLNAGDKSVSIRKVSNTIDGDTIHTTPHSHNMNEEEVTEKPKIASTMTDNALGETDDISISVETQDSFDSPQYISKDSPEVDDALISKEIDVARVESPTGSSDEEAYENDNKDTIDEESDQHFKPVSSYVDYKFPTPSSDAFSAQSAFNQPDSSPTSAFSAPYESLFGKNRNDAEYDSFGFLFQNINQDYRKSDSTGTDRFQKKGGAKGFGGVFGGRDSLFDRQLGEMIERRPSLSLFSRRRK